jgi:hypothetical protein
MNVAQPVRRNASTAWQTGLPMISSSGMPTRCPRPLAAEARRPACIYHLINVVLRAAL